MRTAFLALIGVAGAAWLASVDAAVPGSAPIEAIDLAQRQPIAEGCGYGWHWMSAYTTSSGGWVAGRCVKGR
jgi:hypothetical protein